MAFILLDATFTSDRKVRYVQFGDECRTLDEARKLARFPNLRKPIVMDLAKIERVPERLVLAAESAPSSRPPRKR